MERSQRIDQDEIYAVSIRWKTEIFGIIVSCNDRNEGTTCGFTTLAAIIQERKQQDILDKWEQLLKQLQGDSFSTYDKHSSKKNSLLAIKIEWKTEDFLVTRIGMQMKSLAKPHLDFRRMWFFERTPRLSVEQQIISPFSLQFTHSLVLYNPVASNDQTEDSVDTGISFSYGVQIDVGFVGVSWHVAKSRFGLSDAYSATVVPLLNALKRKKNKQDQRAND